MLTEGASATERAPSTFPSSAGDMQPIAASRRCPYCLSRVLVDARKCRRCGEWLVPTSAGVSAALLRAIGQLWIVGSLLGAFALWHLVSLWRARAILEPGDPSLPSPTIVGAALYGLVALVAVQGLVVGLGIVVFAGLAPKRPR